MKAYSLTELLVLVTIIAILLGLVFPVYQNIVNMSASTKCAANLRHVGAAGLSLIADHNGKMPDALFWRYAGEKYAADSLMPYLGFAPEKEPVSPESPSESTASPTVLSCPAAFKAIGAERLNDWNRTYSINTYACATEGGTHSSPSSGGQFTPEYRAQTLAAVSDPASMCFFMDADFLPNGKARRYVSTASKNQIWSEETQDGLFAGHREQVNVVFLDGHVEAVSPADIPTSRINPFWGGVK